MRTFLALALSVAFLGVSGPAAGADGWDPGALVRDLPAGGADRALATRPRWGDARLLVDGAASFAAREALVRSARRRVLVQQLYWPVGLRTGRMLALLADRLEQGVQVRLLLDRLATPEPDRVWLRELDAFALRHQGRRAVILYSAPVGDVANDIVLADGTIRRVVVPSLGKSNVLHLNHSKIIAVDGRQAITGGINHSDLYAARGRMEGEPAPLSDAELGALKRAVPSHFEALLLRYGRRLDRPDVPTNWGWRDTDVEVRGPIVGDLEASFERFAALSALSGATDEAEWAAGLGGSNVTWRATRLQVPLLLATEREEQPWVQGLVMRKVEHIPRLGEDYGRRLSRRLARRARRRLWCHVPYFLMPEAQARWLAAAARRGVDVRLLTNGPDSNDLHRAVSWAGRGRYWPLLRRAGPNLRIYEWIQAPLHSKLCLVDDHTAVVGSNNRDVISQHFSAELEVVLTSRAFARRVDAVMRADLEVSRRITVRESRLWWRRVWGNLDLGRRDWGPVVMGRALEGAPVSYLESQARLRGEVLRALIR